jgi:hypothetical protein
MVPKGRRLARLSDAGQRPPFCLALVGLHPDQGVDHVRRLAAPGAVPFDDQQRAVGGNLDRSFSAVPGPSRRAVADRPALVNGDQDPFNEQVGPAEAGMRPGDVVGVDHRRSGNRLADPCRQRGLAAVTAPVYCHGDRTAPDGPALSGPGERLDDRAQRLGAPRPGFGLLGG